MIGALESFNARHPWSHNDLYTPLVLLHARRVRRAGGTLAVDVGCGTGHLLRSLAPVMPRVHGIEVDAPTAATAAAAVADLPHVVVEQAPFTTLPERSADLLTFVAALHHLPLESTLQVARSALRPGGRLVVVGAYREVTADLPLSLLSLVLNPLVGLVGTRGLPAHRRSTWPPPRRRRARPSRRSRRRCAGSCRECASTAPSSGATWRCGRPPRSGARGSGRDGKDGRDRWQRPG